MLYLIQFNEYFVELRKDLVAKDITENCVEGPIDLKICRANF